MSRNLKAGILFLSLVAHSAWACAPHVASGNDLGLATTVVSVLFNCASGSLASSAVQPYFSVNGRDWNDYVSGSGNYSSLADTACTAASNESCLHAGTLRALNLSGVYTSCVGLSFTDSLGAFQWTCDSTSGRPRAVSTGFNSNKGMADLLDFSTIAWRENSVTVTDSCAGQLTSAADRWWSNSVGRPDGGVAITASSGNAGGVVLIDETNSTGTSFNAGSVSRMSLVVKDGVRMSGNSAASHVVRATGRYFWLEGDMRARSNNDYGVRLNGAEYVEFRNLRVDNTNASSQSAGLAMLSTFQTRGYNIAVAGFVSSGILMSPANRVRLDNVRVFNNLNDGLEIQSSSDVVISNILGAGNGDSGVFLQSTDNSVLSNITLVNNSSSSGFLTQASDNNTITNLATLNNGSDGFEDNGGNGGIILNLVSAHNGGAQVSLSVGATYTFTGFLKVNILNCTGSSSAGVDTGCSPSGSSDYVAAQTGIDLTNDFQGKITFNEPVNPSDDANGNGTVAFSTLNDWFNFDHNLRIWGMDGAAFIASDNRGNCSGASTCRIWDWALRSSAGTNVLNAVPFPSGDSFLTHTFSDASQAVHLRGATEIVGDGLGDDDGLCESGETCLVSPNVGVYQGHGSLVSAGDFIDGTITGVTLMKYSDNGR